MLSLTLLILTQATPKTPTRQIAAEQQAMQALAPAPPAQELNALKPLLGNWKCDGQIPALAVHAPDEPVGGAKPASLHLRRAVKTILSGHWFEQTDSASSGTQRTEANARFGFSGDRFVLDRFDSAGSRVSATATGWQLGKWTWQGEETVRGLSLPFRQTLTMPEHGAYDVTTELQVNGQWQTVAQVHCRR